MNNTINKNNFITQAVSIFKANLKSIIILLSIIFIIFLSFQIYSFYSSNKILKHSITFFKAQNLEEIDTINDIIINLSNENNFYGILSKLELIKINLDKKNNQKVINLYLELLNNKSLDKIYKSAIASKASYQFINLNFENLSLDYFQVIKDFISYIDNDLVAYQGVKLELKFLTKILEVEKNNIKYHNFSEIIDMYNNIMNSDVVSSATKERINKVHEFYFYK